MWFKVVHNNCPMGILLSAIVTLKSMVSQRFSAVCRGLNRRTDSYRNCSVNWIKGEAASIKHKCYSLTFII